MSEKYSDIIKAQIGRVSAKAKANNYFPVVNQTVKIDAETKWGQTSEWQTNDGSGETETITGNLTLQKDSKEIIVTASGELQQKFIARNYLTETVVFKMIYAMLPQVLPYFDVRATEIVRIGDTGSIQVWPEHGYSGELYGHTIVRIYRENEVANPVRTIDISTGRPTIEGTIGFTFNFTEAADRGIYDIEIDVTSEGGVIVTKRINKLVTVTPKLCPKPTDTSSGYEVVSTYRAVTSYAGTKTFDVRLWRNVNDSGMNYAEVILPKGDAVAKYDFIPLQELPAGTTLCLKLDPQEPEFYPFRMLVQGGVDSNTGNENGTPNFTREAPLVITHDNTEVWNWRWRSFGSMQFANNCRNIVLDGRGYNDTGIYFTPFDDSMQINSCIFLGGGLSYFEMFGCDIDGTGFAGISAKTDPNANAPWYWRGNFEMYLSIHHCTIQNTYGEGVYIGYFGTGELGSGDVKYYAHLLRDLRLYRCKFYHTGFDPVQITNAVGVEVCYLDIEKCCYKKEANQANTFSCGMDGKLYNCKVWDNFSSLGIIFPLLGTLEIFNNILTCDKDTLGFSWTHWTGGDPATDETLGYKIYNNVIKARTIASVNGNISYKNFTMNDNVFITSDGDTSLPGDFTGDGNIFIKASEEYDEIDRYLKVADSANYDYQPNYDSQLISAGKSVLTGYDMRGYKRWYKTIQHCGPLMGIYKADLEEITLVLSSITLEQIADKKVRVNWDYKGAPVQYRIGEQSDLSDSTWENWKNNVTYEFASAGEKTLYAQMKDVDGVLTDIRFASITLIVADTGKATINVGWTASELTDKKYYEWDGINKITKAVYSDNPITFYWEDGAEAGIMQKNDGLGTVYMQESTKGNITGNDSGIYPDSILERNIIVNTTTEVIREFTLAVPAGKYKVSLFASTIASIAYTNPERQIYKVTAGGITYDFPKPEGWNANGNLAVWLEKEVTADEDGIKISLGSSSETRTVTALNMVRIEKLINLV